MSDNDSLFDASFEYLRPTLPTVRKYVIHMATEYKVGDIVPLSYSIDGLAGETTVMCVVTKVESELVELEALAPSPPYYPSEEGRE